jgi:hypothetical protein
MGNFLDEHHCCINTIDINDILFGNRFHLTASEVSCLYQQFNAMVGLLLHHPNCRIENGGCSYISEAMVFENVMNCGRIGYYNGDVLAFHLGLDPIPYILFEHNNREYKKASEIVQKFFSRKNLKSTKSTELGLEKLIPKKMLIKQVFSPFSKSKIFYWD